MRGYKKERATRDFGQTTRVCPELEIDVWWAFRAMFMLVGVGSAPFPSLSKEGRARSAWGWSVQSRVATLQISAKRSILIGKAGMGIGAQSVAHT
jgi:hypothetical protein